MLLSLRRGPVRGGGLFDFFFVILSPLLGAGASIRKGRVFSPLALDDQCLEWTGEVDELVMEVVDRVVDKEGGVVDGRW